MLPECHAPRNIYIFQIKLSDLTISSGPPQYRIGKPGTLAIISSIGIVRICRLPILYRRRYRIVKSSNRLIVNSPRKMVSKKVTLNPTRRKAICFLYTKYSLTGLQGALCNFSHVLDSESARLQTGVTMVGYWKNWMLFHYLTH
jgi:hypothetical protein